MSTLQIVFSYLPSLAVAACVLVLFRRVGHRGTVLWLGALPLVVAGFSLLATLSGEPGFGGTLRGIWPSAAVLCVLTFKNWPEGGVDSGSRDLRGRVPDR